MKHNLSRFIIYSVLILVTSCNDAGTANKQLEFYYYPSKNVYYDVANNQYIYSVNGGKTWNSFKPKNSLQPATLGNKQIIYSTDAQPWKLNELHRKQYNGKIISITDDDTVTQADVVTDKKIIVKKPKLNVDEAPIQQQPKKESFFKRLFGGKKKNKNNDTQQNNQQQQQ